MVSVEAHSMACPCEAQGNAWNPIRLAAKQIAPTLVLVPGQRQPQAHGVQGVG